MRISDWSSDVCSSDLAIELREPARGQVQQAPTCRTRRAGFFTGGQCGFATQRFDQRSEERRAGKECVRTCESRWSRYHLQNNTIKDALAILPEQCRYTAKVDEDCRKLRTVQSP